MTSPAFGTVHSAHNIPVGGTSRDFTAVLDLSPTASIDAAGIRLGGSSGAEARYIVDSAVTHDFVPPIRQNFAAGHLDRPPVLPRTGELAVIAHARPRVRSLRALHGAPDLRAARQEIDRALPEIGRCLLVGERSTYRVRRKLALTVQLGADSPAPPAHTGRATAPRRGSGPAAARWRRSGGGRGRRAGRPDRRRGRGGRRRPRPGCRP
jgi:hypothetical protein